jgi:glutaredoxin-related protein
MQSLGTLRILFILYASERLSLEYCKQKVFYSERPDLNSDTLFVAITNSMANLQIELTRNQIHDVKQNLDKVRRETHLQPPLKLAN